MKYPIHRYNRWHSYRWLKIKQDQYRNTLSAHVLSMLKYLEFINSFKPDSTWHTYYDNQTGTHTDRFK